MDTLEDEDATHIVSKVSLSSSSSSSEEGRMESVPLLTPPPSPSRPKLRRNVTLVETSAVQRLVEYFVIVSCKPRWNSSNNNSNTTATTRPSTGAPDPKTTSGNIHMPHQSSEEFTFKPEITSRYPTNDHTDNPLNPMILQFCFPSSDVIVPVTTYEMPRVHHFVLTLGCGRKLYATCLTVLEELVDTTLPHSWNVMATSSETDGIEITEKNDKQTFYLPKVICLLSTWPYLTAFREYLSQLYRLATTTDVMTTPIERYIVNICCEIPAPPPGAYEIRISILDSKIRFWAPPAKLPIAYVSLPFEILFQCLDLHHVLDVWKALVLERKILLISSQYSILTVCAEILCSLLFPLRWSHLYVPMLPRMLCPMLDAPVPYLVGLVRENWMHAQQFVSTDTIVVDLDRNQVRHGPDVDAMPTSPPRKTTKLQNTLVQIVGDVHWKARGLEQEYAAAPKQSLDATMEHMRQFENGGEQWEEKLATLDLAFNLAYTPESLNLKDSLEVEQSLMDRVQEAFLRFFVALLQRYRKYIQTKNVERPIFDMDGFLRNSTADNVDFLSQICATQQFDDFITRRLLSPGEPDLCFFDQSIDAKRNRSKLKLKKVDTPMLQSAKVHKQLTLLDAVPPTDQGLPPVPRQYMYDTIPEQLDEELYCRPRPIPQMISAEFDRQELLVAKLRSEVAEVCVDTDTLEFLGGDYDASPEVATFTVFLLVYSALVGREWQLYRKRRLEQERQRTESGPVESREPDETETPRVSCETCSHDPLLDTTISWCGACFDEGASSLATALEVFQQGAQSTFKSLFRPAESCSDLFAKQEDRSLAIPETAAAAAEFEEAREVASAQLEVAFDALSTMALRRLSVDSDAYLSLMEACGRCGDRKRAVKLIKIMRKDGFVADGDLLASFVAAFAHEDIHDETPDKSKPSESDAYARMIKKDFESIRMDQGEGTTYVWNDDVKQTADFDLALSVSEETTSDASSNRSTGINATDWMHIQPKKRARKRKRVRRKPKNSAPVTDLLERHLELGENLLEYLYPDLTIETACNTCPQCSHVLSEAEVIQGWTPAAFTDYTTKCAKCNHRFIPHLVVSTSSPDFVGSQGPRTPLYCEFLSPWVLRKELQFVKVDNGIEKILDPSFRSAADIQATLFWNLMTACRNQHLPFTFLLQGSFKNRLILPRQPHEMA